MSARTPSVGRVYRDGGSAAPRLRTTAGDPLTTVVVGLLALVAGSAAAACLVYAVWWLVTYWAPA